MPYFLPAVCHYAGAGLQPPTARHPFRNDGWQQFSAEREPLCRISLRQFAIMPGPVSNPTAARHPFRNDCFAAHVRRHIRALAGAARHPFRNGCLARREALPRHPAPS